MAEKNTANIGFEKQIWDAACVLWGHIPASEYRNVIIGLIFLRYISTAFDKKYQQLLSEGDGFEDDPDAYLEDNVFFVPVEARWDKIAAAAHKPEIGTTIDNAMRAIEADNKKLKNVLPKIMPALIWINAFLEMLSIYLPIWIWGKLKATEMSLEEPTNTALRNLRKKKEKVEENSIRHQVL